MSSIQEAIEKDFRRERGPRGFNPVACTQKQELQNGTPDDFQSWINEQRAVNRAKRLAEGGRGGGYNERQERASGTDGLETADGFDDFGRRVRRTSSESDAASSKAAKAARAKEALERLHKRVSGDKAKARSKSRSRSPQRR
mmetsp:Transcript_43642/g.102944  ORF Transcript_43642/g.102944 Transcript_43642/m.102944 type:complete len:142 (-) Transcript_43642:97-522(-)